jgi:hypothetical protein
MDLKNPRLIYLKGFLSAAILAGASAAIILRTLDWTIAALLVLVIWSAARVYYFLFYVIEKYVDGSYRFAGVFDFLKYLARGSHRGR